MYLNLEDKLRTALSTMLILLKIRVVNDIEIVIMVKNWTEEKYNRDIMDKLGCLLADAKVNKWF